jgi:hypothetical protein
VNSNTEGEHKETIKKIDIEKKKRNNRYKARTQRQTLVRLQTSTKKHASAKEITKTQGRINK